MSDPAEETNGEATSKGRSSASGRVDARKADFASLRNARANAGVHKAHVKEVEDVYESVDEVEYASRKAKGRDWIEDDTGNYSEEENDDLIEETEQAAPKKGGKKAAAAAKPKKSAAAEAAAAKKKKKLEAEKPNARINFASAKPAASGDISQAFLKATSATKKKKTEDDLDDLLDMDLMNDDEPVVTKPAKRTSPPRAAKSQSNLVTKIPIKMEVDEAAPTPAPKRKSPTKSSSKKTTAVPVKMEVDEAPVEQEEGEQPTEDELAAMAMAEAVERSMNEEDGANGAKKGAKKSSAIGKRVALDLSIMTDDSIMVEDEDDHTYMGSDWFKIAGSLNAPNANSGAAAKQTKRTNVVADFKPLLDANGHLLMYWMDAYEDLYHRPGTVYVFGHVWDQRDASFHSITVAVQNLQRVLHFYPKEGYTIEDVRQEFNELRKTLGIKSFLSKKVEKYYAFEVETVPRGKHDFLEVLYPFSDDPVPVKLEGKTFAHVFGTSRTALETLILDSKLMGPGWIVIKNPTYHSAPSTWCSYECDLADPENLLVAKFPSSSTATNAEEGTATIVVSNTTFKMPPTPKLKVLSIKVQVLHDHEKKMNEIVAVSCIERSNFDVEGSTEITDLHRHSFTTYTILRKVPGITLPVGVDAMLQVNRTISLENTEKALLNHLMARIGDYDPDVIVGHGLTSFDLDVLLHRMHAAKVTTWSKLGRLQKSHMPRLKGEGESSFVERQVTAGRLLCDTYTAASEFLRSQKNYKLSTLARVHLDAKRVEMSQPLLIDYLSTSPETIRTLVANLMNDSYLTLQLVAKLDVLPLTKQLTELGGNLWSRSLTGARAERIEYLLMHKFYDLPKPGDAEQLSYIIPDKVKSEFSAGGKKKNKPAFKGGLVLAPKSGLYQQYTLLLDFNSLYPSLIQEYNVCFTTVERSRGPAGEWLESEPPSPNVPRGVLPATIRELVDRRREVKRRLVTEADESKRKQLDMRQLAIKLVANSMYGCLGFKNSRFFAMPLAELVTRKGRAALEQAQSIASTLNMEVIYGDTDSIMINTHTNDYSEVRRMGTDLKKQINKKFNELEIDIDGIFRSMLLLQKKKYAAMVCGSVKPDGTVELSRQEKGLDLVRRDWCMLAGDVGRAILDCIFAPATAKAGEVTIDPVEGIQDILRQTSAAVKNGEVPLAKFEITKSMTKRPEDYPDAQTQPHVQVALALRKEGIPVMVGEMIQYIVCITKSGEASSSNAPIAERARHPSHVKKNNLKIDYDWYLTHQIHPSAARLCEHIPGLDSMVIAECLGLDAASFRKATQGASNDMFMPSASQQSLETRFADCERWKLNCPRCSQQFTFDGLFSAKLPSTSEMKLDDDDDDMTTTNAFFQGCCCPNPECKVQLDDAFLENQLILYLRKHQGAFFAAEYECDGCGRKTREPVIHHRFERRLCPTCLNDVRLSSNPKILHNQLLYLKHMFDLDYWLRSLDPSAVQRRAIAVHSLAPLMLDLKAVVDDALGQNKYSSIPCSALFSCFDGLRV